MLKAPRRLCPVFKNRHWSGVACGHVSRVPSSELHAGLGYAGRGPGGCLRDVGQGAGLGCDRGPLTQQAGTLHTWTG